MTHEPECPCSDEGCSSVGGYDKHHDSSPGNCRCGQRCYCDRLLKAYRRGYNDHARTVQHWQDTHGAYRQKPPAPACPWFVRTNLDQRIYCSETGEHSTHTYLNVFRTDASEYALTIHKDES